ncbi:unnamed protein product [Alternaria alternata]
MHDGSERNLEVQDDTLASPKIYDVSGVNRTSLSKGQLRVPSIHPYLAASISATVGTLTMYSIVVGCLTVGSSEPLPQSACATSIVASSTSWIAATYSAYQGFTDRRATFRGTIVQLGKHIGLHKRGEQVERPAYQYTAPDGQDFIFTIYSDENGEVQHSISFAHNAQIVKRQDPGYSGVEIDGGLDIKACQQNGNGDWSDIHFGASSMYDFFYDDIACLINPDELVDASYINADIIDTDGFTLLTIGMSPWQGISPYSVDAVESCTEDKFGFIQTCVF